MSADWITDVSRVIDAAVAATGSSPESVKVEVCEAIAVAFSEATKKKVKVSIENNAIKVPGASADDLRKMAPLALQLLIDAGMLEGTVDDEDEDEDDFDDEGLDDEDDDA